MPRRSVKDATGKGGGGRKMKGSGAGGRVFSKGMLSFKDARAVARKYNLKSQKVWHALSKSGQRPANIPSHPDQTYSDAGWVSWPDWLGNGGTTPNTEALSFEDARAVARKYKLKSVKEWQAWSKSGQRPSNIPSAPNRTYSDAGWVSWPDWLGYGSAGGSGGSQSSSSSSSSSATREKKKTTKKKRKQRPSSPTPGTPPPLPPQGDIKVKVEVKVEEEVPIKEEPENHNNNDDTDGGNHRKRSRH